MSFNEVMELLWHILLDAAIVCLWCATIYIAIHGDRSPPRHPIARFITGNGWAALLFFLIPMQLGEFARREASVLPWVAFMGSYRRHGLEDGIVSALMVTTVELWILYIPAKLYVEHRPELDPTAATMARWLNLAVGLLLLTPGNPIYWIVSHIPSPDPDEYP